MEQGREARSGSVLSGGWPDVAETLDEEKQKRHLSGRLKFWMLLLHLEQVEQMLQRFGRNGVPGAAETSV